MKVVVRVEFVFDTDDFVFDAEVNDTTEAHHKLAEQIVNDQLTEINEEGSVEATVTSIETLS